MQDTKTGRGPGYKGGRYTSKSGYVHLWMPEYNPDGEPYVLEHRFVVEQRIGRRLERHETVHHINGVRDDNRDENLELWHTKSGAHPYGIRANDYHCAGCRCVEAPYSPQPPY